MTQRVENPHYGMVVTDGTAGRVFMLLAQVPPTTNGKLWVTVVLGVDGSLAVGYHAFLPSDEWAEVKE